MEYRLISGGSSNSWHRLEFVKVRQLKLAPCAWFIDLPVFGVKMITLRRLIDFLLRTYFLKLISGMDKATFSAQWHKDFVTRHKRLSVRATSATSQKKSRDRTAEECESWIALLKELQNDDFLSDPDGIFNFDESPFPTGEPHDKVYAECGVREVDSFATGSNREWITTMFGGFASGRTIRPLILYDGKMHLLSRFDNTEDKVLIAVNTSGVMDNKTLLNYFGREIFPNVKCDKVLSFLLLNLASIHTFLPFHLPMTFIFIAECDFFERPQQSIPTIWSWSSCVITPKRPLEKRFVWFASLRNKLHGCSHSTFQSLEVWKSDGVIICVICTLTPKQRWAVCFYQMNDRLIDWLSLNRFSWLRRYLARISDFSGQSGQLARASVEDH